jgi:RNase P/RNase MRP subunit POP5
MVVRDKVGRKRYIAFDVASCDGDLTRTRLSKAIGRKLAESARSMPYEVILVAGGRGIARTDQHHASELSSLLGSFSDEADGFKLKTLKTSGTIHTLKEKYMPSGAR